MFDCSIRKNMLKALAVGMLSLFCATSAEAKLLNPDDNLVSNKPTRSTSGVNNGQRKVLGPSQPLQGKVLVPKVDANKPKATEASAREKQQGAVGNTGAKATAQASSVTQTGNRTAKSEIKGSDNKVKASMKTKEALNKKAKKKKNTKENEPKVLTPTTKSTGPAFKVGDSSWKVKAAQQNLRNLGYSQEAVTGRMTTATAANLKRFQTEHRLPASGHLDDKTYRKLQWVDYSRTGIKLIRGADIVAEAAKYKGIPYVFGGTTTRGFDCSAYVQYIFRKFNANLPRTADIQALRGVYVTKGELKPGDLVFFTTYEPGASHCGIYAGGGRFWHVSSSRGVMLSALTDYYWQPRYYGARRVLLTNGEP